MANEPMFNVDDFLDQPTGPLSTTYLIPDEGEYRMMLDADPKGLQPRTVEFQDKDGNDRSFTQLELACLILDEAVKAKMDRDKVIVRLRVNLDLKEEAGRTKLDNSKGKNVQLGQLREAVGQNDDPNWNLRKLLGAGPFIGRVVHTKDKKDPEKVYANVGKVARIVT